MSDPLSPAPPPAVVPHGLPVPPPAPSKKRNVLLIVAVLLGVPLLLCLGVAGAGALFVGTAKKGPLKPGDLGALVTAGDLLASTGSDAEVDPTKEKTGRETYIDGSVEVSYEYEVEEPPLYVMTTISLENNARDARTTFLSSSAGGGIGVALSGESKVKLEDKPGLLTWGDQVKSQMLTSDGSPAGNFIVVRKGDRVFMTMVAGVYYDDPEALASLLEPKLEAMMKLER